MGPPSCLLAGSPSAEDEVNLYLTQKLFMPRKKAKSKERYPCLIIEADGTTSVSEMNFGHRDGIEITRDNPRGKTVHRILGTGGSLECLTEPKTEKPYAFAVIAAGISDGLVQAAVTFLYDIQEKGQYRYSVDDKELTHKQRQVLDRWRQGQGFLKIEWKADGWSILNVETVAN